MRFCIFLATIPLLRWNSTGITVAGESGISGNNTNLLSSPVGVAFDSSNSVLYIAESGNNRVQKWIIGESNATTVAGQSDGSAGSSLTYLNSPTCVQVDVNDNVYVADLYNHRIVVWSNGASSGTIVAGNGMKK